MASEKKVVKKEEKKDSSKKTVKTVKKEPLKKKKVSLEERKKRVIRQLDKRSRYKRSRREKGKDEDEYDVRIISIRRVTKVKAGGRRLKLSVLVVVGDKSGRIGVAIAKGRDVKSAQEKAANQAKKKMITVSLKGQTIPHQITQKYKAAKVFLKPAAPGTGVIAGGAVRAVVEAAGIKDILSKLLGTKNTIPNVYATFEALKNLKLTRFENEKTK